MISGVQALRAAAARALALGRGPAGAPPAGRRGYAAAGAATVTKEQLRTGGMLEWRTYTLRPDGQVPFHARAGGEGAALRKELFPNWLGFFTCDVGGPLTAVHHLYHWPDMVERQRVRGAATQDPRWQQYLADTRWAVQAQEAAIFKPAVSVIEAGGGVGIEHFCPSPAESPIYELRTYQLHPGYDSVPKLVDYFVQGLPHKVAADSNSELAFFGFVDVGMLNTVIELWRYPSAQASIAAREASRKVPEWKQAIGNVTPIVQHFRSQVLVPTAYSPLQ